MSETDDLLRMHHQIIQMMNSAIGGVPDTTAGIRMPFGGGMFENFDSMTNNTNNQQTMDPGQSFSSDSTFISYSLNGQNVQPQVYQALTTTRTGPGGIKETRKAVSDSKTGVKEVAVEHHIGNRAHIVEHLQNLNSGDQEEIEEYINLKDNEVNEFNNEWRNKAQNLNFRSSRYSPYAFRNSAPQVNQMMNSVFGRSPDPKVNTKMRFEGGGMFGNFGSPASNMNNHMNPGQSFSSSSTFMPYSLNGSKIPPQIYNAPIFTHNGLEKIKKSKNAVSDLGTFMSYSSNGPNRQPQVYDDPTLTCTGPKGINETKNAAIDLSTGVKKLAVGDGATC